MAAFRPDVLSAISSAFVREIFRATGARRASIGGGAVTFVQRFGGSLNLNVHFHVLVIDGAFERAPTGVAFRAWDPPTRGQIEDVARGTHRSTIRWLRRHGLLRGEEEGEAGGKSSPLDACARVAMSAGLLASVDGDPEPLDDPSPFDARAPKRYSARHEGFDVHAAVRIAADDDEGRERLVRYCARPAFALDRFSVLRDGRVAYRVKYPSGRRTHRVMSPVELIARLAALTPPPRYPLVRYHGVLAPHSKWRSRVVPRPSAEQAATCAAARSEASTKKQTKPGERREFEGMKSRPPSHVVSAPVVARVAPLVGVSPTVITVRHWGRLLGGALLATAPRVPWAELLRRTHGIDALVCARCDGRLRVLAAITEAETARRSEGLVVGLLEKAV